MGGLLAWGALALGRVDGALGAPAGPDRLVAAADPVEAPDAAAAKARQALVDRPIDGRAYRVLAQSGQATGSPAHTLELYNIAVARWPRERIARAVVAEHAFAAGDWHTAFKHIDALLRVAPASRQAVLAAVLPYLELEPAREALLARVALDPPWRGSLSTALLAEGVPEAGAEMLLAELAMVLPPSEREMRARATLLQRSGRADAARTVWLDTLPEEERSIGTQPGNQVFDGGFELGTLRGVYDWQAGMPAGVAVGISTRDAHAGEHALSISFSGRAVQFAHLRQQLALAPGEYRLESWSRGQVRGARPFAWRLTCQGEGGQLLELPLPQGRQWQSASTGFHVPPGCHAQQLALRHTGRNLAERRLRGSLMLDSVRVERVQEQGT